MEILNLALVFCHLLIIYCMGDTGGPGPEIFVLQSDEGARENTVRVVTFSGDFVV